MDNMDEHPVPPFRPALLPAVVAELLPGHRLLPKFWWHSEFAPGTTLLARRLAQQRRALLRKVGRMKHDPDVMEQIAQRRFARSCWHSDPAGLHQFYGRSAAIH